MANIELDALETLDIQAWRTEDDGDVTLIVKTDDGTVRIRAGRAAEDADRLLDALTRAQEQAGVVSEQWYDVPDESDLWVTLDRGRYWVSQSGKNQPGAPRNGYPTRAIAVYEAARWQAEAGRFSPAWITGEHGPAYEEISDEIRAYHDDEAGDKIRPLPGRRYMDGDLVSVAGEPWPTWVVDRDYGDLGVMVHTQGDPDVFRRAQHDELTALEGNDPADT